MRHDDFINGLIAEGEPSEYPEYLVDTTEVKGRPGHYYPKPLPWETSWLGFFTVKHLGNDRCSIACNHCVFHTTVGPAKFNQDTAEAHWYRKHTPSGKEFPIRKPRVVDYKGEVPF